MNKKIKYDILLGERFYHTMISKVKPIPRFVNGRIVEILDMQAIKNEVRDHFPTIVSRPDLRILF